MGALAGVWKPRLNPPIPLCGSTPKAFEFEKLFSLKLHGTFILVGLKRLREPELHSPSTVNGIYMHTGYIVSLSLPRRSR